MIWPAAIAVIALVLLVATVRAVRSTARRPAEHVDPLFVGGIALTGAGAALALTLGGFMFVVMIVGLIAMAVGAIRTRRADG